MASPAGIGAAAAITAKAQPDYERDARTAALSPDKGTESFRANRHAKTWVRADYLLLPAMWEKSTLARVFAGGVGHVDAARGLRP
jgi:hypothetical protein